MAQRTERAYTLKGLEQSACADRKLKVANGILVGPERRHGGAGSVARRPGPGEPARAAAALSPPSAKPDGDWQREFIAQRTSPWSRRAGRPWRRRGAGVGPGSLPEGVRLATHCMGLVPAATYRRALECIVTFDRRANLPDIGVPTLLIAGEHDRNAPAAVMKKMAGAIARSSFIEMKGIGHLQNLEAPEEFDGLLLNFLALPQQLLQ